MKLTSTFVPLSIFSAVFAVPTNPTHICDRKRSLGKRTCDINCELCFKEVEVTVSSCHSCAACVSTLKMLSDFCDVAFALGPLG